VARIHHKALTVGAESIDALGHVNNREYLRWMEEVALEHSAAQGWPMARYLDAGMAWVASTHHLEYLRPAQQGEALDVYTWIVRWSERDCIRRYAVQRERKLLARGETLWTFVDLATGRAQPIPDAVLASYPALGDDDPELRALGLVRRERRGARTAAA
jgi:acyl-CoA thioester hydrolase